MPTNYCQELTYWFLRLNGFLLLDNFVIHQSPGYADCVGEIDILAFRNANVYEPVGGQKNDWHPFFADMGVDFNADGTWNSSMVLIVEAKGGASDTNQLERAFSETHLRAGLLRIGLLSPHEAREAAAKLATQQKIHVGKHLIIAKLLVFNKERATDGVPQGNWFSISTMQINQFMRSRIDTYLQQKQAGWHLFPKDLFQFLIWSEQNAHVN